jgi:hypothetical protein
MQQIQKAKRHRGSDSGRQEPLAMDPRDPDIERAHRIAHRNRRSRAGRVRSGSYHHTAPVPGGSRSWPAP